MIDILLGLTGAGLVLLVGNRLQPPITKPNTMKLITANIIFGIRIFSPPSSKSYLQFAKARLLGFLKNTATAIKIPRENPATSLIVGVISIVSKREYISNIRRLKIKWQTWKKVGGIKTQSQ